MLFTKKKFSNLKERVWFISLKFFSWCLAHVGFGVKIKSNVWRLYLRWKWPRVRLWRPEFAEGHSWSGAMSSPWVLPQLGTISCKREGVEARLLFCAVVSVSFLKFSVSLGSRWSAVWVFSCRWSRSACFWVFICKYFLLFWLNKSAPAQGWSCKVFEKVLPLQFSPLTLCPLMINSFTSLFDPVLPAEVIDLPLNMETKSFTGWMLGAWLSLLAPSNVTLPKPEKLSGRLTFESLVAKEFSWNPC